VKRCSSFSPLSLARGHMIFLGLDSRRGSNHEWRREQVASLTLIRPPLSRGQIDKLRTELGENPDITLDPEEYGMHQTQTIDFVTIVSGEVDLRLDDAGVHLKAGDCVIQRGTRHAWRNRSTEPCVLSAVLVSTKRP
jgi:hypothetical protein